MKVFEFSQRRDHQAATLSSPKENLLERELALRDQIAKSEQIAGEENPWLADSYLELGTTVLERALVAGKDPQLLQESLFNFSKALNIAEANGDLNNRIRALKEMGICEAALGNEERSHEVSRESLKLRHLQVQLELIPSAERLRYDQPAMPSEIKYSDRLRFEAEVGTLSKSVLSFGEDVLTPKRIGKAIVGELLRATERQQWIDDLFVLELANRLDEQFSCGEANAGRLAYGALPIAARYLELGLKPSTLERLSRQ